MAAGVTQPPAAPAWPSAAGQADCSSCTGRALPLPHMVTAELTTVHVSPALRSQATGLRLSGRAEGRTQPRNSRRGDGRQRGRTRRTLGTNPPGPTLPRQQTPCSPRSSGACLWCGGRGAGRCPWAQWEEHRLRAPSRVLGRAGGTRPPGAGKRGPQAHGPEPHLGRDHSAALCRWNRGRRTTAMRPHAEPSQPASQL